MSNELVHRFSSLKTEPNETSVDALLQRMYEELLLLSSPRDWALAKPLCLPNVIPTGLQTINNNGQTEEYQPYRSSRCSIYVGQDTYETMVKVPIPSRVSQANLHPSYYMQVTNIPKMVLQTLVEEGVPSCNVLHVQDTSESDILLVQPENNVSSGDAVAFIHRALEATDEARGPISFDEVLCIPTKDIFRHGRQRDAQFKISIMDNEIIIGEKKISIRNVVRCPSRVNTNDVLRCVKNNAEGARDDDIALAVGTVIGAVILNEGGQRSDAVDAAINATSQVGGSAEMQTAAAKCTRSRVMTSAWYHECEMKIERLLSSGEIITKRTIELSDHMKDFLPDMHELIHNTWILHTKLRTESYSDVKEYIRTTKGNRNFSLHRASDTKCWEKGFGGSHKSILKSGLSVLAQTAHDRRPEVGGTADAINAIKLAKDRGLGDVLEAAVSIELVHATRNEARCPEKFCELLSGYPYVDLSQTDGEGNTALNNLCGSDYYKRPNDVQEMLMQLLENPNMTQEIKTKQNSYNITPLSSAALCSHPEAVKALLDANVDPTEDPDALRHAVSAENGDSVTGLMLLLQAKSDPTVRDGNGMSALFHAPNTEKMLLLLGFCPHGLPKLEDYRTGQSERSDIHLPSPGGRTALHHLLPSLSTYGGVDKIKMLLDAGIKVDHADNDNQTALELALKEEDRDTKLNESISLLYNTTRLHSLIHQGDISKDSRDEIESLLEQHESVSLFAVFGGQRICGQSIYECATGRHDLRCMIDKCLDDQWNDAVSGKSERLNSLLWNKAIFADLNLDVQAGLKRALASGFDRTATAMFQYGAELTGIKTTAAEIESDAMRASIIVLRLLRKAVSQGKVEFGSMTDEEVNALNQTAVPFHICEHEPKRRRAMEMDYDPSEPFKSSELQYAQYKKEGMDLYLFFKKFFSGVGDSYHSFSLTLFNANDTDTSPCSAYKKDDMFNLFDLVACRRNERLLNLLFEHTLLSNSMMNRCVRYNFTPASMTTWFKRFSSRFPDYAPILERCFQFAQ